MKKIFTLFLMTTAALAAMAQCVAFEDANERNFSTISSFTYYFPEDTPPVDELTFEAKCVPVKIVIEYWGGDLKVAQSSDGGSTWSDAIFSQKPAKNEYKGYSVKLARNTNAIKFYTTTGATGYKYFRYIHVSQASYAETAVTALDFDSVMVGDTPKELLVPLAYSAIAEYPEISVDDDAFSAGVLNSGWTRGCSFGVDTVRVYCNPTAVASLSANLTIGSISIPLTAEAWSPIATSLNRYEAPKAVKFLRNGKVYIRREDGVYDLLGRKVED